MPISTKTDLKLLKRNQLVAGKNYEVFGPTGQTIKGTYYSIPGTALAASVTINSSGKLDPDYQDETEVHWDAKENSLHRGQRLWVTHNGELIRENKLRFREGSRRG